MDDNIMLADGQAVDRHLIDIGAAPVITQGCSAIVTHIGKGLWEFNPEIPLFQSVKQRDENYKRVGFQQESPPFTGFDLQQELRGKMLLNANVLDYLLGHQRLIPASWKGKKVYFFGTIYKSSVEGYDVRYLYWNNSQWHWDYSWLDMEFGNHSYVALKK